MIDLNDIVNAIANRQTMTFNYDGLPRTVEPHALGITAKGSTVLRAFQIDGESSTDSFGWKLCTVAKIEDVTYGDPGSALTPRAGYKLGDRGMAQIISQFPTNG